MTKRSFTRVETIGGTLAVAITVAFIVTPAALAGAPFWACWIAGTIGWLLGNCTAYAASAAGMLRTGRRR